MDELSGSCPEWPQAWAPVHPRLGPWNELARCAALAAFQRWMVTPAMEDMSLYD
jgi:hypothetical protein